MDTGHCLLHLCSRSAFLATMKMVKILIINPISDYLFNLQASENQARYFFQLISLNFYTMENKQSSSFEVANDFDFFNP